MKRLISVIAFCVLAAVAFSDLNASTYREPASDLKGGPLGLERLGKLCNYAQYESVPLESPTDTCWIQVDLGRPFVIDQVKLYPVIYDWWLAVWRSRPPKQFLIQVADNEQFDSPRLIVDMTGKDFEAEYPDLIDTYCPESPVSGRYVRLTVTKLPEYRGHYSFDLWRFEVISGGVDVAEGKNLSDSHRGFLGKHQLLRPQRPMGETAIIDCPENVTSPGSWHPVRAALTVPRGGVKVGGLFETVMDRNENYLRTSFTVNDMLRDFRIRAGKPVSEKKDRDLDTEWLKCLPGSVAGRFLMGAGNMLRWRESDSLRTMMNQIVDGIEECAEPNGYFTGYPENEILTFEYGGYCRSWVSQGLLEASIAGNEKALPMLRKFYDWFNTCPYLPELVRRGAFGRQGIIPSTRLYHSPVGVPEDIMVAQRYYQENYWMDELTARDVDAIWKIPYDRPHCYLIVTLNAYMDMYMATGETRYLDAVLGGWDIYHDYFTHIGGSISICEKQIYPPKSHLLRQGTGELCGNSFWAFLNQQLHVIFPEEEKYVSEIEKSLYNVCIANQDEKGSIIYHAMLIGHKNGAQNVNTCCEGQGTRIFGALPEFIWSQCDDGVYVNLFNESRYEGVFQGGNIALDMQTSFPESNDVKIKVQPQKGGQFFNIHLRVPCWSTRPMEVKVNGKTFATGQPGTFVQIARKWSKGDVVSFELPAGFRVTKYGGTEKGFAGQPAYALEYGPLLMSAVGEGENNGYMDIAVRAEELPSCLVPTDKPLNFEVRSEAQDTPVTYMPYYQVSNQRFTCFPYLGREIKSGKD